MKVQKPSPFFTSSVYFVDRGCPKSTKKTGQIQSKSTNFAQIKKMVKNSGYEAAILIILWAMLTNPHSVVTFFNPLS
jgi:hypothetical protein